MPGIGPSYSLKSRPIRAISRRNSRRKAARSALVDFPCGPPLRIMGAMACRFRGRNGLCLVDMVYLVGVFSPCIGIAQN
jgi:hypothetical protein